MGEAVWKIPVAFPVSMSLTISESPEEGFLTSATMVSRAALLTSWSLSLTTMLNAVVSILAVSPLGMVRFDGSLRLSEDFVGGMTFMESQVRVTIALSATGDSLSAEIHARLTRRLVLSGHELDAIAVNVIVPESLTCIFGLVHVITLPFIVCVKPGGVVTV